MIDRRDLLKRIVAGGAAISTGALVPSVAAAEVLRPLMIPGQTYCTRCDADMFPTFAWQGPSHIAVRLWDYENFLHGRELSRLQSPTYVFLRGERVAWVSEAVVGEDGWILHELSMVNDRGYRSGRPCPTCSYFGDQYELLVGPVTFDQPSRDSIIGEMGAVRVSEIEVAILSAMEAEETLAKYRNDGGDRQ